MISWRCGLSPGKNPPNLCSWEAVPKVLWKKTPEISLVKRESSGKIELNEIPQCLVKKFNNFHLWIHLRHLRRGDYSMTQWFPKSTDYKNSISWSSHYHLLQLELSRVTWGMLLLGSGQAPLDSFCCLISLSLSLFFLFLFLFHLALSWQMINGRTLQRSIHLLKNFPHIWKFE